MALRKKKCRLWKVYTRTRDIVDHGRFARARDSLRRLTKKLRCDFEKELAKNAKSNPKSLWRYTNSRLKTKSRVEDLARSDGSMATTEVEKAETLAQFYSSVFTQEDCTLIPRLQTMWDGPLLTEIQGVQQLIDC